MQVIGGDRLLEPAYPLFGEYSCQLQRFLPGVRAIGVDKKRMIADCPARDLHPVWIARRLGPDLHLDETASVALHPAGHLSAQLSVAIAGKSTAAVDRNRLAG